MAETEGNGMEMQASAMVMPINRITDDRMTKALQVSPQLMGPTRQRCQPKTCDISRRRL